MALTNERRLKLISIGPNDWNLIVALLYRSDEPMGNLTFNLNSDYHMNVNKGPYGIIYIPEPKRGVSLAAQE